MPTSFYGGLYSHANRKIIKEESGKGHSLEICKFLREKIGGTFDIVFETCDGYEIWHARV